MKRKKLFLSTVLCTTFLVCGSSFFVARALPWGEGGDSNKKQLKSCLVQNGDTVSQIGNTCDAGGKGCKPNPCD